MPKDSSIKSVLIIGSGPIIIGQACEFDYSGSQAARSLREEGIHVSLINSNPATIMTDKMNADAVFLWPLTPDSIEKILKENQIDSVLPTMGGQTALNLAKECDELGIFDKYNCKIIGVNIEAIDQMEDRDKFRKLMGELGINVAKSQVANSFLEGKEIAQRIGFPLVLRPSYTLGGFGGAIVKDKNLFDSSLQRALEASPVHEVLVEQAVLGWKEYEFELLRDNKDDIAIICTIENFDPMGIHTGDSITVAPAMTLSDTAFQKMRDMAFKIMRSMGVFSGGCNVQFSVSPDTEEIIAIEVNPRVSRSSALASKATGYPIAKIAAKLAIGFTLDELKNPVTKTTSAFFEPALDYVIVKIPRWNFDKFKGANKELGFQMKSVGEVMAIGRSFQEALQKACQSLEIGRHGLGADRPVIRNLEDLTYGLEHASWDRVFLVKDALSLGIPISSVQKITKIDRWFLEQINELAELDLEIRRCSLDNISEALLRIAKEKGYSDEQIAYLIGNITAQDISDKRESFGIKRVFKMVDTCAAEFPSPTNYFYSTYDGQNESIPSTNKKIIVLGSGPNRIGQGIEFDYSCVHGILAAKELGYEAIMVNCNPETVSTDFDMADKLYFEPVYWEHLWDIIELEKPEGVIVQLGGQTAIKLSEELEKRGIKIIGTSFANMDLAEDRGRFSDLLADLNIPYPDYGVALNAEEALVIANKVGYPVLVRPSYVLGGQGMEIVINDEDLERAVVKLQGDLPGNRVLIDHFLDRAEEAESDCICDGENVHILGIMEHIEPAGIHSGDSNAVLPPFSFSNVVMDQITEYTHKLAHALNIKGLLNTQFAIKNEKVYVIESNPRASRTVPFICKAYDVPYVNYATKIMLNHNKLTDFVIPERPTGWAIKKPIFSFNKFPEVSRALGPEMKSTGEEILFVKDLKDPEFRELYKMKSVYLSK